MRLEHVSAPGRLARMRTAVAAVLLVQLAGCSGAEPSPTTPELAAGTVSRHGLTLGATAEPATAKTGDAIDVTASLTNDGPADLQLSGSGSGIVFFSVTRLEDGLGSGPPISTGDCAPYILRADEPLVVPFQKSGGFSPGDENAEFMEIYNATPELTLPPGTWRIDVTTSGNIGPGCTGQLLDLALELIVTVTD